MFKQHHIKINDLVLDRDDLGGKQYDPDTALWGSVVEVRADSVIAEYDLGDKTPEQFEVALCDLYAVKRAGRTLFASGIEDDDEQPVAAAPAPTTPVQGQPTTTPQAAALNVPVPTIKPGTIVKIPTHPYKRKGISADRLWVVLAWTKNTQQREVNVTLVNGAQPGEKYNYSHVRVPVGICKPIRFGTYNQTPISK